MTTAKPLPTLDYLKECFELSETSPSGLVWKNRPLSHFPTSQGFKIFNKRFAGKPAGSLWVDKKFSNKKYWIVEICKAPFKVHRIVFSLLKGRVIDTAVEIDHKNGDGTDNRQVNLREASSAGNKQNQAVRSDSRTGVKGVNFDPKRGVYRGEVCVGDLRVTTGRSPSLEVIERKTRELRKQLHKDFCNHG